MNNKQATSPMIFTRRGFHRFLLGAAGGVFFWSKPILAIPRISSDLELQPFAAQIKRLIAALDLIGEPLGSPEVAQINGASSSTDEVAAVKQIEEVLDHHVLFTVEINPESRISVMRGSTPAQLVEQGWRSFLVKVLNHANDTFALE